MSGYGYVSRGNTEARTYDWNIPSYGGSSYFDHVCRPVIIDSEGRKMPIVSYTPSNSQNYVTRTRVVEHVHTPVVVTEYEYSSPTKVESLQDYGIANTGWGRPSSPVYEHPQKVEEFITKVQTEVSRPARTGLNWHNTPSSTGYNGTTGYGEYGNLSNSDWNKPSGNTIRDESSDDYYRRNEILKEPTVIKKEGWERQSPKGWVSRPPYDTPLNKPTNDIGNLSNSDWNKPGGNTIRDESSDAYYQRNEILKEPTVIKKEGWERQSPKGWVTRPTYDNPLSKPTNGIGNFSNSDWNKPSGSTIPNESSDDYYRRNDILKEPTVIKKEGWERQSPKGWVTRPTYDTPLSKPTNDIGAAVEYLKEAAKSLSLSPAAPPAAPQSRLTSPAVSTVPKRDTETIDSKEAARRYGNFNIESRPIREEKYTETINSKEAARKQVVLLGVSCPGITSKISFPSKQL
ncbi:hypothetical protein F0562_019780 [Nyssa sinensis]|uniref:Uncharacterized protein n=1 Tax=Nyssa sinensis TaxID=561372 RepID=A0A5J5BPC2_9ASTE|nr:hypothetical protein F0562_019780 [Nyssa sinensis]